MILLLLIIIITSVKRSTCMLVRPPYMAYIGQYLIDWRDASLSSLAEHSNGVLWWTLVGINPIVPCMREFELLWWSIERVRVREIERKSVHRWSHTFAHNNIIIYPSPHTSIKPRNRLNNHDNKYLEHSKCSAMPESAQEAISESLKCKHTFPGGACPQTPLEMVCLCTRKLVLPPTPWSHTSLLWTPLGNFLNEALPPIPHTVTDLADVWNNTHQALLLMLQN